jgi:hypothetical protein
MQQTIDLLKEQVQYLKEQNETLLKMSASSTKK